MNGRFARCCAAVGACLSMSGCLMFPRVDLVERGDVTVTASAPEELHLSGSAYLMRGRLHVFAKLTSSSMKSSVPWGHVDAALMGPDGHVVEEGPMQRTQWPHRFHRFFRELPHAGSAIRLTFHAGDHDE